MHVLSALGAGHAQAAAEDLLVLATIVISQSLTMHGREDRALRLVLDWQLLVRTQALLEVIAILVTVIEGIELTSARRPIKRKKPP